ncbi:glycosyltransferase [Alginatibacterium sediminis]|uniref:Glycosyltransferase n=2 Tax=Alginatibacterium sediminis TaxID=2164068 RepID=A0A420ELK6_9ALTE|nr:glycosyltransferase [Alginatibacterium sediminis]
MRVLYGVQGTGNGHITRARLLVKALKELNIEVDVLMTGRRGCKPIIEEFGDFDFKRGLSFASHAGKVSSWRTAQDFRLQQWIKDSQSLNLERYDLLINDFEPLSAWVAKQAGLPSIAISHQAALLKSIPNAHMNPLRRSLVKNFAPCKQLMGLHWYHFDQEILPPIIAHSLIEQTQNFYLVYLPFEDLSQITRLLKRFSHTRFRCFHPQIKQVQRIGNIDLEPICRERFPLALAQCSGVFCNSGFELPSEAMASGKKLLVKPLQGQFEQQSNAATLLNLGLASVCEQLNTQHLANWLHEDLQESVVFPNVANAIADWIQAGKWDDWSDLRQQLWSQVSYPSSVMLRIAELDQSRPAETPLWSKLKLKRAS